ncbi:MAG: ABC transporter substrate-binding protein [Aquincola tertiaricarbonis]|uniref:ABC transporter substrate-binding protein n=1 Tax=Aquincola tertiaricarbonis TaxID=391953 RepID=UPI0006150B3D|nr:ABC transporter substrate-binding protein [Aquincola tertiaricarbonis]
MPLALRRRLPRLLPLLVCCFATGLPAAAARAADLTVVAFGGALQEAFRKAYFEPYRRQAGAVLVEDSYTGGFARQKAMVETGQVTWDLVQMDENEMTAACEQGLLEPIDRQRLPHAREVMDKAFARCGVGAFVWSKVVAYDSRRFGEQGPRSWADLWNVERWPGKRGLRKQPRMTLEIALLADGVPPTSVYTVLATRAGQDRAFAKLEALRPHIVWWESGAQPLEWLDNGSVAVTAAYSGRIAAANQQGKRFASSWQQQLYSMDYWTLVKGSPHAARAYELLDLMLTAERQVAFAEQVPYGLTNLRASDRLPPRLRPLLPTEPRNLEGAVQLDTAFWVDHEEELLQRFTRWVARN